MARSEARLQFGIWQQGLRGLSRDAKFLYAVLLTEPTVNHAGVGAVRIDRWADEASMTVGEVEKALAELGREPQVIVDYSTHEVLIRSLIRNDGVADQPYVLKGALKEALRTVSPKLRRALAGELRRLPPRRPDGVSKSGRPVVYPDPHTVAEQLDPSDPQTPYGNTVERVLEPTREAPQTVPEPVPAEGSRKGFETLGGGGRGGGRGFSTVATHLLESKPFAPQLDEPPSPAVVADAASTDAADRDEPPTQPHARSRRGTRISDDFAVTADMVAWTRQHAPHVDGRLETEIFIDYWRAKPGKGALKLDWVLTWKNWMRRTEQRLVPRTSRPSVATADRRIAEAELLKDNPDPRVLAAAGIPLPPRLRALPGGAA